MRPDKAILLPVLLSCLLVAELLAADEPSASSDWPQLLGPQRDGVYRGSPIRSDWNGPAPTRRWSVSLGHGFSAPIGNSSHAWIFHLRDGREVLQRIDVRSGKVLWSSSNPSTYRDAFGFGDGPRATPTLCGDRIITYGAAGILRAVRAKDGQQIWQVDTFREFGERERFFGVASSPCVAGDVVLVAAGGTVRPGSAPGKTRGRGIVGIDLASGKTLWTTSTSEASYSSPVVAKLSGKKRAVFFTREGIEILDPRSGDVVFETPWRPRIRSSVNAATPLVAGTRLFFTTSYGKGALALEATESGFRKIWSGNASLSAHYATPVLAGEQIYGIHGRQEQQPALRCVDSKTGKTRWSRDRFGSATLIRADRQLLAQHEDGRLIIVSASAEGFRQLGAHQVIEAPVRAHAALAHGVYLVRNDKELIALDLRIPVERESGKGN